MLRNSLAARVPNPNPGGGGGRRMGGGGRKRGRTQRKHFAQNRQNVWKHDNANVASTEASPAGESNPNWQPFDTQNAAFDDYYKEQRIVAGSEWDQFVGSLRKPLPASFRINSGCLFVRDIWSQLENDFAQSLEAEEFDEGEAEAIRPLPWYPGRLAWHLNFSRSQLRRNQALERFHEFLKQENEVGNITRQEAVSMVPPLFLDVQPDHHILDMCAAPGSKTFQLLEMLHGSVKPGTVPVGLVVANDVDVQRCNLLIHQTKRMSTANLVVTNHEAQHFPSCNSGNVQDEHHARAMHELQFDRVLCDVPCSGDGTLRKAPDIWRKWNSGMGNGLHRLQVEIAMRGLAMLKVGGRMVYSTCSMNPVENEAVVTEVLRRCGDSVELVDVSDELPELVRRPGLAEWKVRDRGLWFTSYSEVPRHRRSVILPSMFPYGKDQIEDDSAERAAQVNGGLNEVVEDQVQEANVGEVTNDLQDDMTKEGNSSFPLHLCMRIVPHDQNSGAFFITVLRKVSAFGEKFPAESVKVSRDITFTEGLPETEEEQLDDPPKNEIHDEHLASEDVESVKLDSAESVVAKDADQDQHKNKEEPLEDIVKQDNHRNLRDSRKGKAQMQGKWRGVDPVVLFKDEETIDSIISFYGVAEAFPLKGHLVTRNYDAAHVKRIYYISESVRELLELNYRVGDKLKITSLGLKVFERQAMKDGSLCAFRLSSEGLPLLLPYITKQILRASLADFQHLLQYRIIKFQDFTDAGFRESTAAMMTGCCIVVLSYVGSANVQLVDAVDEQAVAVVCWKGKTNLSVMISPQDGKELLERLVFRYGATGSMRPEEGAGADDPKIEGHVGSENAETSVDDVVADDEAGDEADDEEIRADV